MLNFGTVRLESGLAHGQKGPLSISLVNFSFLFFPSYSHFFLLKGIVSREFVLTETVGV